MPEFSQNPRLAPIRRSWLMATAEYGLSLDRRVRSLVREIVELTWLNAVGNHLNLQAKPLGLGSEGFCSVPS